MTVTSIGVCNHTTGITCPACQPTQALPVVVGTTTWEPAVLPIQDGPVVPWWNGSTVPASAHTESLRLRARIRELEMELSQIRRELVALRHHISEADRNATRARDILGGLHHTP